MIRIVAKGTAVQTGASGKVDKEPTSEALLNWPHVSLLA